MHSENGIKQISKKQNAGAILIEFAFAIPVLIAILYFILDGPKLRLYQLQLKNTAHFAINMIQNLTDQRANKFINESDLKEVTLAAFANIYRSDLMLKKSTGYPLGYYGHIYLWCVFGNEDGTASVQWVWASGSPGSNPTEFESTVFMDHSDDLNNTIVKFEKSVESTYIHKELIINPGEVKMILEVSLIVPYNALDFSDDSKTDEEDDSNSSNHEQNNSSNTEKEQTPTNNDDSTKLIATSKEVLSSGAGKLGFYILPLKPMKGTLNSYLNYVAIFTPKPGLFSFEQAPNGDMIKEQNQLVELNSTLTS